MYEENAVLFRCTESAAQKFKTNSSNRRQPANLITHPSAVVSGVQVRFGYSSEERSSHQVLQVGIVPIAGGSEERLSSRSRSREGSYVGRRRQSAPDISSSGMHPVLHTWWTSHGDAGVENISRLEARIDGGVRITTDGARSCVRESGDVGTGRGRGDGVGVVICRRQSKTHSAGLQEVFQKLLSNILL